MEESLFVSSRVPASRGEAAGLVVDALAAAGAAGEVGLIGSMAEPERADEFSDIDIRWTIPPEGAVGQLHSLRSILQRVGEVESLRVDPDERPDSLLVFLRYRGWPLWWRVDLEIHSAGAESMGVQDADPWSPQESACMGVVVTLKALARNRPDEAEDLWARALNRAGSTDVGGDWSLRIASLLDRIEAASPATADLASRTRRLSRDVLGDQGTGPPIPK